MVRTDLPGPDGTPSPEDRRLAQVGLDALTEREYAGVKKRINQLVAEGKDRQTAARTALVEFGTHYWVKGTLKGVIRTSAGGRPDSRAMRSFERALVEVGRVADPVRKVLAELGVETLEDLKFMVTAYQQAQRHEPADRLETAAMLIDDDMKSDPDARARYARRWGFHTGEPDA